jgi:hypothetical protein
MRVFPEEFARYLILDIRRQLIEAHREKELLSQKLKAINLVKEGYEMLLALET